MRDASSILKHQTGINAPRLVLAGPVIDGKDKHDSQPGLNGADGIKIGPESDIARQTVMPGIRLVQLLSSVKFKNGDELLQTWNRQFFMLNRVAENEAIFKCLQSACGSVSPIAQEH